jgi:hypothetical protein
LAVAQSRGISAILDGTDLNCCCGEFSSALSAGAAIINSGNTSSDNLAMARDLQFDV